MDRRAFLVSSVAGLGAALASSPVDRRARAAAAEKGAGEVLYNGIRLAADWPPRIAEVPNEPTTPAYLLSPPGVIPIDVGRQLFVDDFLIEQTTLRRIYHCAEYHPDSPVLVPDQPWERVGNGPPCAMTFSDGVWYDPKDRVFKMWYMGGPQRATCYATSDDGLRWHKPMLDVVPGTNIVQTGKRDSSTVWHDLEEDDPQKRFKMFRSCSGGSTVKGAYGLATFFSPDGIHWSDPPLLTGSCGDRSTVFRNPFRKVWVYSLRHGWGTPRRRRYWETPDLAARPMWQQISEPSYWIGADSRDAMRDDLKIRPELYNLDGVAYESLVLGLFTIWRGQPADREKPNEVCVGFSRDGWSWSRPDHRAFCPVSETPGAWNYSNVQSAGGVCLVVGDKLHFYVSGRGGTGETRDAGQRLVTSLATLRRDGFASLDAGADEGTLTTRLLRFQGKHLFVNVAAPAGELRAEVLDERGRVIAPFSRANAVPIRADATLQAVRWVGEAAPDLSPLAGTPARFRFYLRDGALFAFWVSPGISGASHGYVAAGGPGFRGPIDTVGTSRA